MASYANSLEPPSYYSSDATVTRPAALEKLPSYTTGATVTPAPPGQPVVSVVIDTPAAGHDVYEIGDMITGYIAFAPRRTCTVSAAHVALCGEMVVGKNAASQPLKLANYIVPHSVLAGNGDKLKKGFKYMARFSIHVPHSLEDGLQVPPSLGIAPDKDQGNSRAPARVYYYMTGSVETSSDGEQKVHTVSMPPAVVLSTSYSCPTAKTSRIVSESSSELVKKRFLKSASLGTATLQVHEPVLISLASNEVSTLQVRVLFSALPLPRVTRVTTKLCAVTETKTDAMVTASATTESVPVTQLPVVSPSWDAATRACQIDVHLQAALSPDLVPSFSSPLVSRRYTCKVTVSFEGAGHASVVVPVWVMGSFRSCQDGSLSLAPVSLPQMDGKCVYMGLSTGDEPQETVAV